MTHAWQKLLTDFEASIDWLFNAEQLPHQLEEAILGLIASMDKPGSPAGEAITACYALLHAQYTLIPHSIT